MQYFKYELIPEPTFLFQDQMMRKGNKASLLLSLLVQTTYQHDYKDDESISNIVIDGGCLLRKVVLPKDGTYNDVLQRYLSYVSKKCGLKIMNIKEEKGIIHHVLIFRLKRTLNYNIAKGCSLPTIATGPS